MNVEQIMQMVKECFDEHVSSQLEDFAGSTYSSVTGKEEFLESLEDKLTEMDVDDISIFENIRKEYIKDELQRYDNIGININGETIS